MIAGLVACAAGPACLAQSRPTTQPARPAAATKPAPRRIPSKPAPAVTTRAATLPRLELLPVGSRAPRFEAWSMSSQYIRFPDDYAGQLVLLHVWASWCPACARDYPVWLAAQQQYGDLGLTLLGVSVDYQRDILPDAVQAAMKQRGGTWEVVYEDARKIERLLQTPSLPTLYLVDGDTGEILEAGDPLRRGKLLETLARRMRAKFPQHFPASQPASAPAVP